MTNPFKTSPQEQEKGRTELENLRPSQRFTQKQWDERWHKAGDRCAELMPDLIDERTGVSCGFAVASALHLTHKLARRPTVAEIRRYRNEWMRKVGAA